MTTFTVVVSHTIEVDFDPDQCGAKAEAFAERLTEIVAAQSLLVEAPGLRRLTVLGVSKEFVE